MAHPAGESESDVVRLDFNRRLMLQFRGSVVTSNNWSFLLDIKIIVMTLFSKRAYTNAV
jgi:lipopolysaccharide/colanic/teichoic acid biosynthesis glycosyltransferase